MFAFGGLESAFFWIFLAWYVLEKGKQSRSNQCNHRWCGMLLCDHVLWMENRESAPDSDRHQCITALHGDWFRSWQKN